MVATETVKTIFLVLTVLAVVWVVVCIIKNDMATIIRALVVAILMGLGFFYTSNTKLERLSFKAVKNDLFPPKPEYFTYEKRENSVGSETVTTYIFSEPGPRLVLAMEQGGKFLTVEDIDPLNRTLAFVGLPPVTRGVRELSALTGSTLDANLYRWDDYKLGVMTIERSICRNITTTESFPCISSITIRRR